MLWILLNGWVVLCTFEETRICGIGVKRGSCVVAECPYIIHSKKACLNNSVSIQKYS